MPTKKPNYRKTSRGIELMSFTSDSIIVSNKDFYSIVWVEHYRTLKINFEEYALKGNYLILLCPEEVLSVQNYDKCKLINIPDTHEIVESENFISAFGNPKKCFQLGIMSFLKIGLLFTELQQSIFKSNSHENHHNKLSQILRAITVIEKDLNRKELMLQHHFIGMVHKHYKMHHEMSFYSKKLKTTSKKIAERFHQAGFSPPHVFIKKRVLIEAKRQLAFTDKMIKIICFDVGFNDPAYFARFFKKNTGMTCGQFRKSFKSA